MTLDEFRSKYRLQQRLTQRGVASYQAVDSSGRVVMVHSLDSASREEVDHVRGMIHRLSAVDHKRILEILDVDGAPVLVTEFLQGFHALAQWLEVRTRADPTAPVAPIVQPKGPPRGEFTQLFGPAEVPKTPVVEKRPPQPASSRGCSGPSKTSPVPRAPPKPLLRLGISRSSSAPGPANRRPLPPIRHRLRSRPLLLHLREPSTPRSSCAGATTSLRSRHLRRRRSRRFAGNRAGRRTRVGRSRPRPKKSPESSRACSDLRTACRPRRTVLRRT